jgi:hypothetical protein
MTITTSVFLSFPALFDVQVPLFTNTSIEKLPCNAKQYFSDE